MKSHHLMELNYLYSGGELVDGINANDPKVNAY